MLNRDPYIEVLLNSTLSLSDKQKLFEFKQNYIISYSTYKIEILESLNLHLFYLTFKSINWSNFAGKTYFTKFFKSISIIDFIDSILLSFFINLKFYNIENRSFLRNYLLDIILKYLKINFISYDLKELEKVSSYFIEAFLVEGFFIFNPLLKSYKINHKYLPLNIEFLCTIAKFNWPLIIPGNNYQLIDGKYLGGYYKNLLSLCIKKPFDTVNNLEVNINSLNTISKLQNIKYTLINNQFIINLISNFYNYLLLKLNFYNEEFNIDLLHQFYICFQYLTFIESNIIEIYFPFQLDSMGQIINSNNFGLNPINNKLSQCLVGLGKTVLTAKTRDLYLSYILKFLNNDYNKIGQPIISSLDSLDILSILSNFKESLKIYSIESLILLSDWYYNVLVNNITEICFNLNIFENNFKILSLLANNEKVMIHTNLLSSNINSNLFNFLLERLDDEFKLVNTYKNWIKIINLDFLNSLINTLFYFQDLTKAISILYNSFKQIYFSNYILNFDMFILFSITNIFKNPIISEKISHFSTLIQKYNIKDICLTHMDKLSFEYQLKLKIDLFLKTAYKSIMSDLSSYFFPELIKVFQQIIIKEYFDVLKFIDYIINFNLKVIDLKFFVVYLEYNKFEREEFKINNGTYVSYVELHKNLDLSYIKQNLIFNLCVASNAFFMHHFISNTLICFYPISNSILCRFDQIDNLILEINNSFNFIYNFFYDFSILKLFYLNSSKHILNFNINEKYSIK